MKEGQFLKRVQRYVVQVTVPQSALRSQLGREKGTLRKVHDFLSDVDLSQVRPDGFGAWLDAKTRELMRVFPRNARGNWGAARKAMNLLLIGAYFNHYLRTGHRLERVRDLLETPLDSKATGRLREYDGTLPR